MDYIIDHRRFKKKFTKNELNNYLYKKDRIIQFPRFSKNYYNFFNNYAKKNYKLINNSCLCGAKDDILLNSAYKVSGTAAKLGLKTSYHHCTLLCQSNLTRLRELLSNPFTSNITSNATQYHHHPRLL